MTINNPQDLLLQSTTPRLLTVGIFYDIQSSAASVNRNTSNIYTPTTVTFTAKYTNSMGNISNYAGRFKVYSDTTLIYTSSIDESTYTYTPSGGTLNSFKISLYASGGTTDLLNEITIPVNKDGIAGTNGTNGTNGARGPFKAVTVRGAASWSDTQAFNAITSLPNSGGVTVVGDEVVEVYPNTATPSWVLTKQVTTAGTSSGTTVWTAPGQVIDGNLLVSGTLSAAKITTGTLGPVVDYGTSITGTKPSIDADNTSSAINAGWINVSGNGLNFTGGTGAVRSNGKGYGVGSGWYLGYSSGVPVFDLTDTSGRYIRWANGSLSFNGDLVNTSNLVANAVSKIYNDYRSNTFTLSSGATTEILSTATEAQGMTVFNVIVFSVSLSNPTASTNTINLRLKRNGSSVSGDTFKQSIISSGFGTICAMWYYEDTGGATFSVDIEPNGTQSITIKNRIMTVSVYKR